VVHQSTFTYNLRNAEMLSPMSIRCKDRSIIDEVVCRNAQLYIKAANRQPRSETMN